ncbi:MaoC family dehydratase [Chelativorans sp. YIM 93263]|uniref:MaoC family dehydratase n=1 Tax=Chelativorans sp. YIM 93263 TaxID=2906648 RepID=UPI002378DE42|nr:MaoC family dehydratase [Chelativorans sp. YIM 93263]
MTEKRWAYEDLTEGTVIDLGLHTVTKEEIVEFASAFDPQPMHLDEEAGGASLLGGLAASGWHTAAVFMRMMCEAFILDSTSQGSPGINELRWKRPVLAGDTLSGRSTVLARRPLKSRPGMGLVTFRHRVSNQRGEAVMDIENPILFRLRENGAPA